MKKATDKLGTLLFSLGALVGLTLVLFLTWADLESRLFDPSLSAKGGVELRCPAMVGLGETVRVSASFDNPLDREARYTVRASISEGHVTLMRRLDTVLTVAPGERERIAWDVTSNDAVYGLFALVKVHRFGFYPLPAQQGSCGIVLVPLPLPGGLMFGSLLALTLLAMGGGAALWYRAHRPLREASLDTVRLMGAFSVLIVLGLAASLWNSWLVAVVVLAVSVLLIVALGIQRMG